jgi:hypothetical protein
VSAPRTASNIWHAWPICVSPASWLDCGKVRSSWTRSGGGIASSVKRCPERPFPHCLCACRTCRRGSGFDLLLEGAEQIASSTESPLGHEEPRSFRSVKYRSGSNLPVPGRGREGPDSALRRHPTRTRRWSALHQAGSHSAWGLTRARKHCVVSGALRYLFRRTLKISAGFRCLL